MNKNEQNAEKKNKMNQKTALCSQQPLYSISAEFSKYRTLYKIRLYKKKK